MSHTFTPTRPRSSLCVDLRREKRLARALSELRQCRDDLIGVEAGLRATVLMPYYDRVHEAMGLW